MRIRATGVVMAALLVVPMSLSAQRLPTTRTRGQGPARPAPLPPQPTLIAEQAAYRRLNLSVESYPIVSFMQASNFAAAGAASRWMSAGVGTRVAYRLKPYLSATLDLTQSLAGGPATTETAEVGTRWLPERWDHKAHPFLDVRLGYMHAYDTYVRPVDGSFTFPSSAGFRGARYSHGLGGIAGAGVEYSVTRTIAFTAATSVMRTHMTAYRFAGVPMETEGSYSLTAYRVTFGLRWNPVRALQSPGSGTP